MKKLNKFICSVVAVIALVSGGVAVNSVQPVGQVVLQGQSLGELRVSPLGLAIIGHAEGCRLEPYQCPAGLATNGIGNTHNVSGQRVSIEQVATDWVSNIQQAEQCVYRAERESGRVMTQGQFDAFTSFSFNTGCPRFMRNDDGSQTKIYTDIKQGKFEDACNEMFRWVYGGGEKLPGLVTRRELENDRCISVDENEVG